MRLIFKVVGTIFFVVILGLALKNMQVVTLHFFRDYEIRSPLILLLFGFFLAGCVFGVMGMTTIVFRHHRELSKQKKIIANLQKEYAAEQLARTQPPQPDTVLNQ